MRKRGPWIYDQASYANVDEVPLNCPNRIETDMSSADNVWLTPPANLMLSPDEVHVWRATLDVPDVYLDELQHMLAPDEIRRAEQLRLQQDRHRFIVGRGLLRAIL